MPDLLVAAFLALAVAALVVSAAVYLARTGRRRVESVLDDTRPSKRPLRGDEWLWNIETKRKDHE